MEVCILKKSENLETLFCRKPVYQVDEHKNKDPFVAVWEINQEKGSEVLEWPFKFSAFSSYISIWIKRSSSKPPLEFEKSPV